MRKSLLKVAPVKPPMQRSERPVPVSANPGRYSLGTIAEMWAETKNVYTMRLADLPESVCCGCPGQFLMLDLPGYSAVPISISRYREGEIYLTIAHGGRQHARHHLAAPGSQIGLRGPVGGAGPSRRPSAAMSSSSPAASVCRRCGRSSTRSWRDRAHFGRVRLFYGARTPGDLLFTEELKTLGRA